jgi:hypothetical protein
MEEQTKSEKLSEKEIKKLLIDYRDILNKLRNAGVTKTGKVVGDYGEYIASKKLDLTLSTSASNKGYDGLDKDGEKYEIKTRKATHYNKPTIFPVKEEQLQSADFIIYVEFDDDWELSKMLKIPTVEVISNKYDRVVINKTLVEKYSII